MSLPIIDQNNFDMKPGNISLKIIIIRLFTANITCIYFAVQILLFFSKECNTDFCQHSIAFPLYFEKGNPESIISFFGVSVLSSNVHAVFREVLRVLLDFFF